MIMITFVNSQNKTIKRVFERTFIEGNSTVGVVGKCDCYKNTCDCVTFCKIPHDRICKIENVQIIEGDSQ